MNPHQPPIAVISADEADAINRCCNTINSWATAKGWNETPDSLEHKCSQIALMHSELSECLEYIRKKTPLQCDQCDTIADEVYSVGDMCPGCGHPLEGFHAVAMDDHVPSLSGEAAELADVLIRIFHYCGKRNIDLGEAVRLKHQYNINRPYKHGKKC